MKILGVHIPFTGQEFKADPQPEVLPIGDVAWSEDSIYGYAKKEKYNPDDLIGKKGSGIYREMMMDEQIKAVVTFKRDAITSRSFFFEANEEELGKEEATRRIAISNAYFEQMIGTPIDALNGIMTAMWQGMSVTEKCFMQIAVGDLTYWGIEKLRVKPFDTFKFSVDEYGNIIRFVQELNGNEQELDLTKFIHHVQNPEYDAQYGQSDLREAHRSWFSKKMAINFYNMFLERSASGFKWINTSQTAGTPGYTGLQNMLKNTVNGAGMLMGKNDEFHIEFPAGDGSAFTNAIDKFDLGIARALLVPNLLGITPSGQTGSYSQSDTQLEAFLWTLDQEANRLEEVLNEQLFRPLGEMNFGDDNWPRFRFQPISERRKNQIIGLWKDLVTSGAVKASDTDEQHIRDLLEFPEKDEVSVKKPTAPSKEDSEESQNDGSQEDPEGNNQPKETIRGNPRVVNSKQAYTAAQKRVDFKVIQRSSEMMEVDKSISVTEVTGEMIADAVDQIRILYSTDSLEENMNDIKFEGDMIRKLNRTINSALQDFWKLGLRHAENEIDKAKGLAFSMKIDRKRLNFISEDFFKQKSFKAAGKLSDDMIAIITNIINSGVKGGKTFAQIEDEIYLAMGSGGFISEKDYKQALGSKIDPKATNPQSRVDTMLRTNGFEAINEARFSYFTDPALNGFVEALEYSAVLDSRTTQICTHMDGHVHASGSETWQSYRPPLHYNCRSLLIPVTQTDSWTESGEPTQEPQKGFK